MRDASKRGGEHRWNREVSAERFLKQGSALLASGLRDRFPFA